MSSRWLAKTGQGPGLAFQLSYVWRWTIAPKISFVGAARWPLEVLQNFF